MNDVLHHATTTLSDTKAFVASAATQYLPNLLKSTQSANDARSDKVTKVLKLWTEKAYFNDDELSQIMEKPIATTTEKPVESKPLVQPSMLGRAGDTHWLLPVSCMLEVMVPPSTPPYDPAYKRNSQIHTNQSRRRALKPSNSPKNQIPTSSNSSKPSNLPSTTIPSQKKKATKSRSMQKDGTSTSGKTSNPVNRDSVKRGFDKGPSTRLDGCPRSRRAREIGIQTR
jgi:CID domain